MPWASQFLRSRAICSAASGSVIGPSGFSVGTSWSIVATVRSGLRTARPARSRPSKACGDVTSCTRCRSMYSSGGSPSGLATRCRFHTLSNRRPLMGWCSIFVVPGLLVIAGVHVAAVVAPVERDLDGLQGRRARGSRVVWFTVPVLDSRVGALAHDVLLRFPDGADCQAFQQGGG